MSPPASARGGGPQPLAVREERELCGGIAVDGNVDGWCKERANQCKQAPSVKKQGAAAAARSSDSWPGQLKDS